MESTTTFTSSNLALADQNPLFLSPSVRFQVVKPNESFDNAANFEPSIYNPSVRCDIGKAKANTKGCVYSLAVHELHQQKVSIHLLSFG